MDNIYESRHIGWTVLDQVIMFPKDEIVEAKIISFKSDDPNDDLDGRYIVRLIKKNPTIEFVCANDQDAEKLMEFLNKSRKVVNLKDYRKDK